jgi:glycosyltransferase involved in cell wall biosynthesis
MIRRDFLDDARTDRPEHVVHDVVQQSDTDTRVRLSEDVARALEQLPREPFILFVGALRRVKGVPELLAAYESLAAPPPLVLVGTLEPDTPTIPTNVEVLTDLPYEAVLRAWDRSLFGVMPSLLGEPFGTVVCEAMSRGKAVIGTTPSGHTDMITNGATGLLVPRGDVALLAHAMQTLIDQPELREHLAEAARARASEFTAEVSLPRIERLYALAAEKTPRQSD